MTQTLVQTVSDRLKAIVGADQVITHPDRLVAYESDGLTAYRVAPRAVVLPETTEQVSKVLKVLHEEGIDVIPRGAGTGLSGGALPTPDG
ncbi:MAG: FAD-binding oxidoreductase, partial [Longimicrobiales bacterium]